MSWRPPPGVVALLLVATSVAGTVFTVHRNQALERKAMRQAVLRDIEKLGR
jgi:hypothetical protein